MNAIRKLIPILFASLLTAMVAGCAKPPKVEFLPLDLTGLTTEANIYGHPSTVFSKDNWPTIEYIYNGAFVSGVVANFFLVNSGGSGEVTLTSTLADLERITTAELAAGKSYIVRVVVDMGRNTAWGSGVTEDYSINLAAGDTTETYSYTCNISTGIEIKEIRVLELDPEGEVSPENFPDEEFLTAAIWVERFDKAIKPQQAVRFLEDGQFLTRGLGENQRLKKAPGYGKDEWRIDNGELLLSFNDGSEVQRYELTSKDAGSFLGTSSIDEYPRRLSLEQPINGK